VEQVGLLHGRDRFRGKPRHLLGRRFAVLRECVNFAVMRRQELSTDRATTERTSPKVYLFGPFRLEVAERRLLRDGQLVPLTGKAFDTLQLLVEGAGTLQKQEWLMDRLWPNIFVEQNNLQYNISLVRHALADAPGVEIETVRRQGCRLIAKIHELSATGPATPPPVVASAQHVRFCTAGDGTRLAYAFFGEGPPLVKVAHWLSHIELDRQGPLWTHWLHLLSQNRRLLRYDARGNGLSDWNPPSLTFEDFVADLGVVFDAANVERAPLLGISQGAAVAVAYAARRPERVSGLILIGGCARGWRVKDNAQITERFQALMTLMRQGWGGKNAAFRQIFTSAFFPEGPVEQMEWFNELQRQSASPTNAAAILSAVGDADVRKDLPHIKIPTLVLHSRFDAVVPMKDGIELASGIAGARFVPLESPNHVWLANESAWSQFSREFESFLQEIRP
jgi:pimeloyl-ACP methyl ester carboxylesterase/DNA-binding winged helix-turn-helix (wHTH) protein